MHAVLALGLVLVCAAPVAAHMVVVPGESEAGGWERYTLVVPTEKNAPTVRVEIRLPMGMQVMGIEAKPGWQAVHNPLPLGAATIRWSGGSIPAGQLMTFDFLVWNPPAPRTLSWDATQWYEDGTSDRWGEPENPERPPSTTVLKPASARTLAERAEHAAHGHGPGDEAHAHAHAAHDDEHGHAAHDDGHGHGDPDDGADHAEHAGDVGEPASARAGVRAMTDPRVTLALAGGACVLSILALGVAWATGRRERER